MLVDELKSETESKMVKSVEALQTNFNRIRTGRAHPSLLESIRVDYYGSETPLDQVANVVVEDARTLSVTPWEKTMVQEIEKAIMKSDLGLNPATAGVVIRIPMPALTEETRKGYVRQARQEAENARISVRNARRDAMNVLKEFVKDKEISEDEERRAHDDIQKITDAFIVRVDETLAVKESDLLEI